MAQPVSTKNTKTEILAAYEELLEEVRTVKRQDIKTQNIREKARQTVEGAAQIVPESVVKNLTEIKLQISKKLDEISEQLVNESKKLQQIQQAIETEKQNLKEKYDITTNADTLDALLLAQQRRRDDFETEMKSKREHWTKEHKEHESNKKEQEDLYKKMWQRKEDEYKYKIERERQLDMDEYNHRKAALERDLQEKTQRFNKEFQEREQAIKSQESELLQLREQVAGFPEKLVLSVEEAETKAREQVELKYQYQNKLAAQEMAAERKLHQQVVQSLEAKIKEHEARINLLNEKANKSSTQVQEIALKAIESSSTTRPSFGGSYEKQRQVQAIDAD